MRCKACNAPDPTYDKHTYCGTCWTSIRKAMGRGVLQQDEDLSEEAYFKDLLKSLHVR